VVFAMVGLAVGFHDQRLIVNLGAGYASMILIAVTLLLGPWRAWRGRPVAGSFDLRRDTGIAAGVLGLVHVALGLQVHMGGRIWLYFVPQVFPPRGAKAYDFLLSNYLGLAATLLLVLLLTISNDLSVRRLGSRWKAIQAWNTPMLVLVLAHALGYQLLELRPPILVLFMVVSFAATLAVRRIGKAPPRRGT
jgi:sulfoxide reductase heme-binding subunit YedZ